MSKYDYLHALYQALIPLDSEKRNKLMREIEDSFRNAEENGLDDHTVIDTLGSPQDYAKQFIPIDEIKEVNNDDISLDSLRSNATIITKAPDLIGNLELASDPITDVDEEVTKEITEDSHTTLQPTHYNSPKTTIKKVYTSPSALSRTHVVNHPVKIIFLSFAMLLFNSVFVLGPFVAIWSIVIAFVASGFAIGISGLAVIISGLFALPLSFISVPLLILNHPVLLFSLGFLLVGIGGLLTTSMIYMIRFFGYLTMKYFGWNLSVIRGY